MAAIADRKRLEGQGYNLTGGTLFISRAYNLFSHNKKMLEEAGFTDVHITGEESDSLRMIINEIKPNLVLIDADFDKYSTPFKMCDLPKKYPKLNIAAVSFCGYPLRNAMNFILYGIRSYVDYWDGVDEFNMGLTKIREGKKYISQKVNEYMENNHDYDLRQKMHITDREFEVLRWVCSGLTGEEIAEVLGISLRTVNSHKKSLRKIWNLDNERELISMAFSSGLITKDDICLYHRKDKRKGNDKRQEIKLYPDNRSHNKNKF